MTVLQAARTKASSGATRSGRLFIRADVRNLMFFADRQHQQRIAALLASGATSAISHLIASANR